MESLDKKNILVLLQTLKLLVRVQVLLLHCISFKLF